MMKAVSSSETWVNFYRTILWNIPEDIKLMPASETSCTFRIFKLLVKRKCRRICIRLMTRLLKIVKSGHRIQSSSYVCCYSIFKIRESVTVTNVTHGHFLPGYRTWRRCVPPKHLYPSIRPHGVTTHRATMNFGRISYILSTSMFYLKIDGMCRIVNTDVTLNFN